MRVSVIVAVWGLVRVSTKGFNGVLSCGGMFTVFEVVSMFRGLAAV